MERLYQEGDAHVVSVRDGHVPIVELVVTRVETRTSKLGDERSRAPDERKLVLRPAVHVDDAKLFQIVPVAVDQLDGVPVAPSLPDIGLELAGLDIEREIDPEMGRARVRRVVRGHAEHVERLVPTSTLLVVVGPIFLEPFGRSPSVAELTQRVRE